MGLTLKYGSQGNDVKDLQQKLNNNGANLAVDGIYGENTESAVRNLQQEKGLTVDGIAGRQTMAALLGSGNKSTGGASTATGSSNDFTYDAYTEGTDVQRAMKAYNDHLKNKPGEYTSQWQTQLNDVMDKINNRDKFTYDVNGDALYQQYKDQYINQGKLAMQDTMGQAAAMTGGYGNSYAATVGNQAYQASLQQLNNVIPELYQMAYDRYNQEGQDLLNQYGIYSDRENTDYGRYRDTVSDWNTDRDYLAGRYDSERSYDYGKYSDERNFAYGEHRDAIADGQWKANMDETMRQFDETMAFNTAQANVVKDKSTGSYTPKSTSMSTKEYNEVMTNAEMYAEMGETQFALYINAAVENGFPSKDAEDLYDLYFPEEELPKAKTPENKTGNKIFDKITKQTHSIN